MGACRLASRHCDGPIEAGTQLVANLPEDALTECEPIEPLTRQVRMIVAGVERACPLPEDSSRVRKAADDA